MKLKFLMSVLFCTTLISCGTVSTDQTPTESEIAEMSDFTYTKIAIEENGVTKLLVTENSVLKSAKRFSKLIGQDTNPQSLIIETIGEKKYLRIINDDKTVSTVELMLDESNIYTTGGTICRSNFNSSGGGCIPEGLYCTPLTPGKNGTTGGCERTTTAPRTQVGQ